MNPYTKAEQLMSLLKSEIAACNENLLPSRCFVTSSEPVVDDECLIVSFTSMAPSEGYEASCNVPTTVTYSIVLARQCANISDASGMTIEDEAERVARSQSLDMEILSSFANSLPVYVSKTWNIALVITGGLAITSLILTTGID